MKRLCILAILSVLGIIFIALPSCARTPAASVDTAIVQVWNPATTTSSKTLLAFGIVVGDGSQVLTVLNYEDYTPGNLEVVLPGQSPFNASIQAVDPRTSATLLKLKDAKLSVAPIGDASAIKAGQQATIWGWPEPQSNLADMPVVIAGYDIPTLPFSFNVYLTNEVLMKGGWGWVYRAGNVVTDEKGSVLGLVGTDYTLVLILGPPGRIPPVVSINSALELLSPDAISQPWASGPALTVIANRDSVTGHSPIAPSPSGYDKMTAAIKELLGKVGEPLAVYELPQDYRTFAWPVPWSADGTLLTVLYPRPVELRSIDEKLLALAKWVGIQWGRSEGKPNRLFYGSVAYTVEGGFILNGDITNLENALH